MYIQGDLQAVFDALYSVGAIDPVLKADWKELSSEMTMDISRMNEALTQINSCSGDREKITHKLWGFDRKLVQYIAVEVARELAEFTDRQTLH